MIFSIHDINPFIVTQFDTQRGQIGSSHNRNVTVSHALRMRSPAVETGYIHTFI
jgi:hypothetical protein